MPDPSWFTVTATCDAPDAELVADLLWRAGPPAVEERITATPERVALLAGFPDEELARRTAAEVAATGRASTTVTPVVDDGLDAWRAHAQVERAGRFVVVPPWNWWKVPSPSSWTSSAPGNEQARWYRSWFTSPPPGRSNGVRVRTMRPASAPRHSSSSRNRVRGGIGL